MTNANRGRCRLLRAAMLGACVLAGAPAAAKGGSDTLWQGFLAPPADTRPMMRWWWFGPAVTDAEIDRELRVMRAAGIGGVEVQVVYPLVPDLTGRPAGQSYPGDGFLASLRHAATTARAEGMRIDVTIGSGWPFGGPHIPVDQASSAIRLVRMPVAAGSNGLSLPAVGPGERIVAAAIGPAAGTAAADRPLQPLAIDRPRIALTPQPSLREALVFIAGRTGQQVKRPGIGGEGFVMDHIDPAAVANHLTHVGEPLLRAFAGMAPPDAMFSDSLEAYGASWTPDLPDQFRRRRGYDLLPHLPALFLDRPDSAAVRYDWARTLSELVDERYLAAIDRWASAHGTRFRAQVYGFPPPTLSSNAHVALPEGEGQDWRRFTSTRWATSAAHLFGRPVVSSEVWTWLHSPAWAATPLDMKMEADRHFLQGVNQLIGHGWPYSAGAPGRPDAGEPGPAFYAAAALNDHNPWFGVMPDVSRYLQRASFLLRQGTPANAVAVYLPIEDAFAAMKPDAASANEAMERRLPHDLVPAILGAGHGFDFVDAGAIARLAPSHRLLIVPAMTRIDAAALATIDRWVARGGRLIVLDGLPRQSGGLRDAAAVDRVRRTGAALLRRRGVAVVPAAGLATAIDAAIPRDVTLSSPAPDLGVVHRRLGARDLYFLVNSGNTAIATRATFAGPPRAGEWWDAVSGRRWPAGRGAIDLSLAPYESRFLLLDATTGGAVVDRPPTSATPLDTGWTMAAPGSARTAWTDLRGWTADPRLATYSGTITYRRTLRIDTPLAGRCVALDFGAAPPVAASPLARPFAAVAAPVRDAAVVRVNGRRVGALWSPPYRIDLAPALKQGDNVVELEVANTALNALSAMPAPDLRLLHLRYGQRFAPQDTELIAAQPSGLLRHPQLAWGWQGSAGCTR